MPRFALIACLSLAACVTTPAALPSSPSVVADKTVLDEKLALGVETTYRAARTAVELAVDAGAIRGETAVEVARMDREAYAAVRATRAAYAAGNATNYIGAAANASLAVSQLLTIAKGEVR